jgi:peptide/nickel transport system permease protein
MPDPANASALTAGEATSWDALLPRRRSRRLRTMARIARQNPPGAIGAVLVLVVVLAGLAGPWAAPYTATEFSGNPSLGPSWDHPFGTTRLGEDVFSRVLRGARISVQVGIAATIVGVVLGTLVGLTSGFKRGWYETIIQRGVDTWLAFPGLLLLLMLVSVFGRSTTSVIFVIGLYVVPGLARIVHGATLGERNAQYVEAAQSVGMSDFRIMWRHVLPNVFPVIIVLASGLLGTAILFEASLSFLGLGVPPPNPSWGADVSAARSYFPIHIWVALFPGAAISIAVLGVVLMGDMLRDVLDPRLRNR